MQAKQFQRKKVFSRNIISESFEEIVPGKENN